MPTLTIELSDNELKAVQWAAINANPLEGILTPEQWVLRRLKGEIQAAGLGYADAFDHHLNEELKTGDTKRSIEEVKATVSARLVDPAKKAAPPEPVIPAPKLPESRFP